MLNIFFKCYCLVIYLFLILKYQSDQSVTTLKSDSGSLDSTDSLENPENVDQLFENASPMVITNFLYYFAYFYYIIFFLLFLNSFINHASFTLDI